ncbi:hypothetical protein JXM67_14005 [candidate division WOR-3 bacterium]|nr:hypothetical protein [candidate division WOR-3 bacterium]
MTTLIRVHMFFVMPLTALPYSSATITVTLRVCEHWLLDTTRNGIGYTSTPYFAI